jgi:hypothetical protein
MVEAGEPQVPLWQFSPEVQALLSSQVVSLALLGFEQTPLPGLQIPALWHWSSALQVTVELGDPQFPLWHVSPLVQALPSLHAMPLSLSGSEHSPLWGSQVPSS